MYTGSYQWPHMLVRQEQSESAKAAIALLETLMKYEIVVEQAEGNYSAYAPELPGCVATGATENEVYMNIMDAIRFHVEGLMIEYKKTPNS